MSNLWKIFEAQVKDYSGYVPPLNFDRSVYISLKNRYFYVETPKVACSSVKTILHKVELEDPCFSHQDFEDIHKKKFTPLLSPSQVGDFKKLEKSGIYKFCFSRNPYTRLLSAYLEKIRGNKPEKRNVLLHLGWNPSELDREITFEEFVNVVCEQPIANMDPHWRVQYYQTYQHAISFDFVGKLEAFPADLCKALRRVTPDYTRYMTDERRHAQKAGFNPASFYDDRLVAKVSKKFAKDFEFFGYSSVLH